MFVVLFCFSCLLESKNPLSAPETAVNDEKLCGIWKFSGKENKDKDGYLAIFKNENNFYQFVLFDKNYLIEEDGIYNCFVTQIGNENFLNVKPFKNGFGFKENELRDSYFFMHYKIFNNFLNLSLFNNDYMSRSIEEGKIKGEIKKSDYLSIPFLDDESENLYNFVKESKLADLIGKDRYDLVRLKLR